MKQLAFILAFIVSAPLIAQERVTFSAPVLSDAGATTFRVAQITFNFEGGGGIVATLKEFDGTGFVTRGKQITVRYDDTDPATVTILRALNTVDLSVKSLQRRLIERFIADGKIPTGTPSGVPQ